MKLTHSGIIVDNIDQAIRFYRDVIGLRVSQEKKYVPETNVEFAFLADDETGNFIELMRWCGSGPPKGVFDHIGIFVEDLDETLRRVQERGGKVECGPITLASGLRFAFVKSSFGGIVEYLQRSPNSGRALKK